MNSESRIRKISHAKKLAFNILNLLIFLSFVFLSIVWLGLKLKVSQQLGNDISLLAYADIIRSQTSLDLALCLIFLSVFLYTSSLRSCFIGLCFFFLMSFYFLKLTGLYVYTYDATPWQMIEYGSYMLSLPFAGEMLSYFGYIVLPFTLLMSLFYLVNEGRKEKQKQGFSFLLLSSVLLIAISLIPPIQDKLPKSIAYHPYVYSISGSWKLSNNEVTGSYTEDKAQEKKINLNKNIVYIVLESVSYNAINADVSPFLASLKKESFNFTQARANIPHTSKALISIHCGQTPYLSPYLFESIFGTPELCLPQQINSASVFFQPVTRHFEKREALIRAIGFKDFYPLESLDKQGFEPVNYFSYEDNIVLKQSYEWIEKNKQAPFVASYLTGTSHHNYDTPKHFENKYFHHEAKYNRYLNSVAYVDQFVEKLILQYKQAGIYEDSIFILVGDHGEGFDKSQSLMHNNNIYESGLHIPLIIHSGDTSREAREINGLIMQSDIQDFIYTLVNTSSLQKSSIKTNTTDSYLFSSCWYMNYCYAAFHKNGKHLFKLILDEKNQRTLLFELNSDPLERNNISHQHSNLVVKMTKAIKAKVNNNHLSYKHYFKGKNNNYETLKKDTFSHFTAVDY